jgi:hypothetical protein
MPGRLFGPVFRLFVVPVAPRAMVLFSPCSCKRYRTVIRRRLSTDCGGISGRERWLIKASASRRSASSQQANRLMPNYAPIDAKQRQARRESCSASRSFEQSRARGRTSAHRCCRTQATRASAHFDYRAAVLNGTLARTSMGRLAILSEVVTTHTSPAGCFGLSARNAPTLTTHRTVAATAAATTSEDICSPSMRVSMVSGR